MRISIVTSLLGLATFAVGAQASPIAMAAHVTGRVVVEQGAKKTPLRLLGRLENGAKITCGPASSAVIVLFGTGTRFQIGAGKSAVVKASSVAGGVRLAALDGPSAGVVKLLGDARVGAAMSRPAHSYQRLLPDSHGYIVDSTPRFDWLAIPGASKYTFTLFDRNDNVVWSTTSEATGTEYPADAPPLAEKRPYLWKLSGFGASGKPLPENRWGIVTILSTEDAASLESLAADLKKQAATSTDKTPLLLLIESYRSYGVLNDSLEVLDSEALKGEPGVAEARADLIASLSPFARALAATTDPSAGATNP